MADCLITWVDDATDQYLALDPEVRDHLDGWGTEFDGGQGLVVDITGQQHQRVVILRILHPG